MTIDTSFSVDDPKIPEVMDETSGEYINVKELLRTDWQRVMQIRMQASEARSRREGRYLCPLCGVAVYLISTQDRTKAHFRHEVEDGSCPSVTRGNLSMDAINAIKFHGLRESRAHYDLKLLIAESLRADPAFSQIEVEQVWKGIDKNTRRKPDVCAVYKDRLPVAFEIQLSTTFLQVIAERRQFYLRNGGLLFWVFKAFDETDAKLTQQDVFYNNNRNIFLAGDHTLQASMQEKALCLDAHWHEPGLENGEMYWTPKRKLVRFDSLVIEQEKQRAFYFDADAARARIESERSQILRQQENAKGANLRDAFEKLFVGYVEDKISFDEMRPQWAALANKLKAFGIHLPKYLSEDDDLRFYLQAAYSAKLGRPVASSHENMVRYGHHIVDKRKGALWAFRLLLGAYDRVDQMRKHDPKGNWAKKAQFYRESMRAGDTTFAPDRRHEKLICFLFPEIADDLVRNPSDVLNK